MAHANNTRNQPAKVKICRASLPPLGNAEEGELFYDHANTRLALRTTEGWKTFAAD